MTSITQNTNIDQAFINNVESLGNMPIYINGNNIIINFTEDVTISKSNFYFIVGYDYYNISFFGSKVKISTDNYKRLFAISGKNVLINNFDLTVTNSLTDTCYGLVDNDGESTTIELCKCKINFLVSTSFNTGICKNTANVLIKNCEFEGNLFNNSAGICRNDSNGSTMSVQNCKCIGYLETSSAGILHNNFSREVEVLNCSFEGSMFSDCAGIVYLKYGKINKLIGCTSKANISQYSAGIILNYSNIATLENCNYHGTIGQPDTYGNSAGILLNSANSKFTIKNCVSSGDIIGPSCAGIYKGNSDINIYSCEVNFNITSQNSAGCAYTLGKGYFENFIFNGTTSNNASTIGVICSETLETIFYNCITYNGYLCIGKFTATNTYTVDGAWDDIEANKYLIGYPPDGVPDYNQKWAQTYYGVPYTILSLSAPNYIETEESTFEINNINLYSWPLYLKPKNNCTFTIKVDLEEVYRFFVIDNSKVTIDKSNIIIKSNLFKNPFYVTSTSVIQESTFQYDCDINNQKTKRSGIAYNSGNLTINDCELICVGDNNILTGFCLNYGTLNIENFTLNLKSINKGSSGLCENHGTAYIYFNSKFITNNLNISDNSSGLCTNYGSLYLDIKNNTTLNFGNISHNSSGVSINYNYLGLYGTESSKLLNLIINDLSSTSSGLANANPGSIFSNLSFISLNVNNIKDNSGGLIYGDFKSKILNCKTTATEISKYSAGIIYSESRNYTIESSNVESIIIKNNSGGLIFSHINAENIKVINCYCISDLQNKSASIMYLNTTNLIATISLEKCIFVGNISYVEGDSGCGGIFCSQDSLYFNLYLETCCSYGGEITSPYSSGLVKTNFLKQIIVKNCYSLLNIKNSTCSGLVNFSGNHTNNYELKIEIENCYYNGMLDVQDYVGCFLYFYSLNNSKVLIKNAYLYQESVDSKYQLIKIESESKAPEITYQYIYVYSSWINSNAAVSLLGAPFNTSQGIGSIWTNSQYPSNYPYVLSSFSTVEYPTVENVTSGEETITPSV